MLKFWKETRFLNPQLQNYLLNKDRLPLTNNQQQTTNTSATRSLSARPERSRRVVEVQCKQPTTKRLSPYHQNNAEYPIL